MKKWYLMVICLALIICTIGVGAAFADWQGPYTYNQGYNISWQPYVNLSGYIWQWAEWQEDPSSSPARYDVLNESLGYIAVNSGSVAGVTGERVEFFNSYGSWQGHYFYFDWVQPGYWWSSVCPSNDTTFNKYTPDLASMSWQFGWNYLAFPGPFRPGNSEQFFYPTRSWSFGQGAY
jgi:hypothetical protein